MPTDETTTDTAFSAVASAIAPLPIMEAEAMLSYMLAIVGSKRRAGLPAAGIKAELADLVGRAVDDQYKAYDATQAAG
jgi:hypothetical protein